MKEFMAKIRARQQQAASKKSDPATSQVSEKPSSEKPNPSGYTDDERKVMLAKIKARQEQQASTAELTQHIQKTGETKQSASEIVEKANTPENLNKI